MMKNILLFVLVISGCSPMDNDNLKEPIYNVHDSFQILDFLSRLVVINEMPELDS